MESILSTHQSNKHSSCKLRPKWLIRIGFSNLERLSNVSIILKLSIIPILFTSDENLGSNTWWLLIWMPWHRLVSCRINSKLETRGDTKIKLLLLSRKRSIKLFSSFHKTKFISVLQGGNQFRTKRKLLSYWQMQFHGFLASSFTLTDRSSSLYIIRAWRTECISWELSPLLQHLPLLWSSSSSNSSCSSIQNFKLFSTSCLIKLFCWACIARVLSLRSCSSLIAWRLVGKLAKFVLICLNSSSSRQLSGIKHNFM